MTPKQKKFIELYTGNAAEAAILAGYSEKTAYSAGNRLLKNPEIVEAIQKRQGEEMALYIATRQERQEFWTAVARDESQNMKDRLKASELLGRSEGDFLERREVVSSVGVSMTAQIRKTFLELVESSGQVA